MFVLCPHFKQNFSLHNFGLYVAIVYGKVTINLLFGKRRLLHLFAVACERCKPNKRDLLRYGVSVIFGHRYPRCEPLLYAPGDNIMSADI